MVVFAYVKVDVPDYRPGWFTPANRLSKRQAAVFRSSNQAIGRRLMMQNEPGKRVRTQLFHIAISTIGATSHRQLLARTEPEQFLVSIDSNLLIQFQRLR